MNTLKIKTKGRRGKPPTFCLTNIDVAANAGALKIIGDSGKIEFELLIDSPNFLNLLQEATAASKPLKIYSVGERGGKASTEVLTSSNGDFVYRVEELAPGTVDKLTQAGFLLENREYDEGYPFIHLTYPEYGHARFYEESFGRFPEEIIFALGIDKYSLRFDVSDKFPGREKESLIIEPVDPKTPETPWLTRCPSGYDYIQLFGQPQFVQHDWFITDKNGQAIPLLFLWSGWGDCGTEQFFVKFRDGNPSLVIRECSCG